MEMTFKYIKVLNWGYVGFSPMTISSDYKASLEQAKYRLSLLDGLDYGALFVEATSPNGKANLLKYQKTEDSIEYSLHFMRDRKILLDVIPTMFKCFKDGADRFKADGLWTDEQWREYRVTLSQVERGFELRLKQFATAYDYSLSDDLNSPEPQQELIDLLPEHLKTDRAVKIFQRAIDAKIIEKTPTGFKKRISKACLAYFLGHFLKDGTFPETEYNMLFGESRLGKALTQLPNNKHGNGKPKGYEEIDKICNIEQPQ